MRKLTITLFIVALALAALSLPSSSRVTAQDDDQPTDFHLRGTAPQIIGQYPDSFNYDGSQVRPQEWGFFEIHFDAEADLGLAIARFSVDEHALDAETTIEDAVVTVIYLLHGMADANTMPAYWEGGIADYLDLHGDSGAEAPVLPTIFNNFGTWGPTLVFVNDEQYSGDEMFMGQENTFGLLMGHTMWSEMVRNPETGEVFAADGETYFDPAKPGDGSVFSEEISLLHVVAHTETRDTENFPPFSMFLHVNFYEFEEIEPLDIEYLSWEDMADITPEAWEELVAGWLELADQIEAEVLADDGEEAEDES
ncbi:MAG: hypothetical protein L0154_06415 [Chloroflexi bacterium]|nr:hypothetical protein [Chloroflexota bacterium]